jgi:hypothetical protein
MKPRAYRPDYTPPKLDSGEGMARSMLRNRPHMNGITVNGIRCQHNLRMETAQRLYDEELARRANNLG